MAHQESFETAGTVLAGKLVLANPAAYQQAIRLFPDGDVVVRISHERPARTLAQNAFWHGVVIPAFAEHCGYRREEMKDVLALELLPREVADLKTGEVRTVPGHTSELNVKEFTELIDRAQQLGAEMGIVIPDPEWS